MSTRLSQKTKVAIRIRDLACRVCTLSALGQKWPILQHRVGDATANGVVVCPMCASAVARREVGIAGSADETNGLKVTDAREALDDGH